MTGPVVGAKKDMGHQKQLTVAGKLWSLITIDNMPKT